MEKRKVVAGLLIVIAVVVSLVLVGPLTEKTPEIERPAGFFEPEVTGRGFLVTDLSIQPVEVQPDGTVTITVSVANTDDTRRIYSLVLKIDGLREAEKQVKVNAGSRQEVSFSVTREIPGSYSVLINGLSGSFTVVAPGP